MHLGEPAVSAAVDAGTLTTKIAFPADDPAPRVVTRPAAPGGERDVLSAALAAARSGDGERICIAVPDQWLDGSVAGGRAQETWRHIAEDDLGLSGTRWVGQLTSVAALTASQHGFAKSGLYAVCDVGGCGVRAAACDVTDAKVRTLAVHHAAGGGWQTFNAAVKETISADGDPGLASWYQTVAGDRRAKAVLDRARKAAAYRDARFCRITGAQGSYELSAGQAADCFLPTASRIQAALKAVLGEATPVAAAVTGGLAWFPAAAWAVAETAGITPAVLGPDAAARGALLIASGNAILAPHGLPPVGLPMHEIRGGLLKQVSMTVPWTEPFATPGDEPLIIDRAEIELEVGGRLVVARLPGIVHGRYRIGVRPSWMGSGLLVLRPDGPAFGADVHIVSLDALEEAS
jgi:hypothetical protein